MIKRLTLATAVVLILAGPARPVHFGTQQVAAQQSPSNMQDMMKMHEQMMADMKAADAKLDALVKEMNAATGNAKINAVAAVINELVRQHKAMEAHMDQMHENMIGGRGMMMQK